MQHEILIKQFELKEQEALLSFLRIAYPDEPRKSDSDYWKWHFLDAPLATADNIPLWVVKSGDEIVGQLATIPVVLKVNTDVIRAIWILDFVVRQDYRRQGLGKRLVLAARESYPTMLTLGINEQSTAVFQSLGWKALGGINRYQRLLFPGNTIREIAGLEPVRKIVNLFYAPLRPRISALNKTQSAQREIKEITAFDSSFDDLWQKASSKWHCAVERNAQYLEWQFMKQPGKQFNVLALYERDQLAGYIVLFFRKPNHCNEPPKASIADLLYNSNSSVEVIDELLRAALRLAIERRVGSLVIDILDRKIEARLKKFGFWRIKKSPQFMASAVEDQEFIYCQDKWFLTRGDSDVSIFEQSNL